ncbi:MAG: LruC domain-containing protein, partial [Bacteroidales bacterium]|nr:LruC domain-containing protein [Bacteroidales bacterium]
MGDYDFNDVLLDVSSDEIRNTDNNITAITLHLKLSAAGASKTLGCGLRLVGIDKSDITSVTFGGANLTDFQNTLTGVMFYEADNGFESNNSDLVIPIFGDVHKVLSPNTEKKLYNTLIDVNLQKLYVVPSKTMDITINFSTPQTISPILKENMDFFITYNTIAKIPSKRTEIHLYEFRDLQSGVGLDMSQVLSVAGNYTWAICVPEFRYPVEATKVTDAYSLFASWAQALNDQRDEFEDWYKTVDTNKVYR